MKRNSHYLKSSNFSISKLILLLLIGILFLFSFKFLILPLINSNKNFDFKYNEFIWDDQIITFKHEINVNNNKKIELKNLNPYFFENSIKKMVENRYDTESELILDKDYSQLRTSDSIVATNIDEKFNSASDEEKDEEEVQNSNDNQGFNFIFRFITKTTNPHNYLLNLNIIINKYKLTNYKKMLFQDESTFVEITAPAEKMKFILEEIKQISKNTTILLSKRKTGKMSNRFIKIFIWIKKI